MPAASGARPSAWTTDTTRRLHGWTDPTKPAAIASSTALLQLSTRPVGRSANRVSTTKRASVRVSFIGGAGPPPPPGDLFPPHGQLLHGPAPPPGPPPPPPDQGGSAGPARRTLDSPRGSVG